MKDDNFKIAKLRNIKCCNYLGNIMTTISFAFELQKKDNWTHAEENEHLLIST